MVLGCRCVGVLVCGCLGSCCGGWVGEWVGVGVSGVAS